MIEIVTGADAEDACELERWSLRPTMAEKAVGLEVMKPAVPYITKGNRSLLLCDHNDAGRVLTGVDPAFRKAQTMRSTVKTSRDLLPLVLLLALMLMPSVGSAQSVGNNFKSKISKGVFDLGFETLLISRSKSEPILVNGEEAGDVSALSLTWTAGVTPRFFVMDNLAVGLNANFFI